MMLVILGANKINITVVAAREVHCKDNTMGL